MSTTVEVACTPKNEEKQVKAHTHISHLPEIFTSEDIESIVERALSPGAEVISYALHPYSQGTLGFLGTHLHLKITARENVGDAAKTLNFFVKCKPQNLIAMREFCDETGAFNHETVFFRDIAPHLNYKHRGHEWGARCYLTKDNAMVFDELRKQGFSIRERVFNEELMLAGLTGIARFHAASLIAETRLGKSFYQLYPHAFEEILYSRKGMATTWYNACVEVAVALAKHLGLESKWIPATAERIFETVKPSRSIENVISHGDLWTNNFMFNNDVPPRCMLVDFQLIRYCSPAHDINQFLYVCTTSEFRRKHEKSLVKHYYNVLLEEIRNSDLQVKPPSWMDLTRSMEEQRLYGVVTAAFYLPLTFLDGRFVDDSMNNSDYLKFMFSSERISKILYAMEQDLEYGSRIKEAVTELYELSLHLEDVPKPT